MSGISASIASSIAPAACWAATYIAVASGFSCSLAYGILRSLSLTARKRESEVGPTHCSHRRQYRKSKVLSILARRDATNNLCSVINGLCGILSRLESILDDVLDRTK